MKGARRITRRTALVAGLASVGGLILPGQFRRLPPTYGNILRMGDNLTYAAHRVLLPGQSLVREYTRADISSIPAIGTTNPAALGKGDLSEAYARLQPKAFSEWRLSIEGLVASPRSYSLADLKRFPSRTQVTRQTCEEGWSAIAEWTGVPLRLVLGAAGILPAARFVNLYSYDDWADSLDLLDALHPQTLLAYGMNGRDLSVPHGAPVRLRVETQLGYKSMKFLRRIVVTDEFDDGGAKGTSRTGGRGTLGSERRSWRRSSKKEPRMRLVLLLVFALAWPATGAAVQERPVVKHVNPSSLSKPTGYTHLVEVRGGRTLYISGQIAVDRNGSVVGKGDLKAQAQQVFENLQAALAAGGATFDNVVKLTFFVTDASQVQVIRDVRDRYIKQEPPASTLVQVVALVRPELLLEVEAIAVVE